MEGGSPRKIEKRWTLHDVAAIRRIWRSQGPPDHIAGAVLCASMGNKVTCDDDASPEPQIIEGGIVGPSIAELASMMHVRPGCDTLEASRAIAQRVLGDAPLPT